MSSDADSRHSERDGRTIRIPFVRDDDPPLPGVPLTMLEPCRWRMIVVGAGMPSPSSFGDGCGAGGGSMVVLILFVAVAERLWWMRRRHQPDLERSEEDRWAARFFAWEREVV